MIRRRPDDPGPVVRDSTIGRGNVQVTGNVDGPIIAGDVHVHFTRPPTAFHDRYAATRNAFANYHAEVLDREDELQHLLDRLRGPGQYHVIEAPAFAGKTAFMVELYRRLTGPTIVFYVVDRYSNRSGDCLDAVTDQLISILHADETPGTADQFARLWDDFTALGTPDHPAVLLVDGLDEQQLTDEISPLLPVHLAEHAHVVVTTRSLPDPRTSVPRHHPLITALADAVPLPPSPHATARTDDARCHLEASLSSADPAGEDIAALLLVARAPLSRHDLADLLGQVARHLRALERCLLPLDVTPGGTGYQWAHAKYSEFVDDWIGAGRRVQAVQQLLAWATRYAADGWPATTPPFLLHGLHHFLAAHGDLVTRDFLVDLVSTARRQRLLTTYGHDRVFLDTIAAARDLCSPDDLELRFRLDLHHYVATMASSRLPTGLLRLLVLSGGPDQAEGLARATEERYRAEAMAEVAEALVEAGLPERARTLAAEAPAYVSARDTEYWQTAAQLACMRAARKAGATEQDALRIATHLIEDACTELGWTAALQVIDVVRRLSGVENCAALLSRLQPATFRAEALAELSRQCRATDSTTADRLLREARHILENETSSWPHNLRLSAALAAVGEYDRALEHADTLGCWAYIRVAEACLRNGDTAIAGRVAQLVFERMPYWDYLEDPMKALIDVMIHAERVDLVRPLLDGYDGYDGEPVVYSAVRTLATTGHDYEAIALCQDFGRRTWPGAALVAWGSAPRWPPDVLRRNLRLLKEVALSR